MNQSSFRVSSENADYRNEIIASLKDRFPSFPDFETELAEFLFEYPAFIPSGSGSNKEKISADKNVLISELAEYRKNLKTELTNQYEIIYKRFLEELKLAVKMNVTVTDLKLFEKHRTLIIQTFWDIINLKTAPVIEKYKISPLELKLKESSTLGIVKKMASDILNFTTFLPR